MWGISNLLFSVRFSLIAISNSLINLSFAPTVSFLNIKLFLKALYSFGVKIFKIIFYLGLHCVIASKITFRHAKSACLILPFKELKIKNILDSEFIVMHFSISNADRFCLSVLSNPGVSHYIILSC